ncbi:MAG: hypothetical protein EWV50_05870 [Microcystis aeruginosa Ma_MB_F_20061100_S20]|uniref:Uncharacterized protein n=1 Tax=Microcystis aeruginosa Ma_MB_F_20061100_S20D TaxID=2486253 RepID=A0A552EBY6_MICAE|nr:MAG: hypothetical protein EWV78_19120 [Microcystis aeruginosa Ma_MB_F_20061100_S20D]TRU41316.1 MAG: hypothetical protein EWV50_05870 [Microcystis aeruginosa Ma_MB_F_20061100_S20]
MAVPEQPKSSSLQKTVSSRLGSHKTVISHQLLDIYQLSVISDQGSVIRFEFSVNSNKWQLRSFPFTDYCLLITDN